MRNYGIRRILLAGILLAAGCTTTPSNPPTADQFALEFEVLDNHQDGPNSFKAALTLINKGTTDLDGEGWTLYFNFGRMPIPESVPAAGPPPIAFWRWSWTISWRCTPKPARH